jgi:threonine/homoserine/homoserine lactone efflux protein
MSLAGLLPGPAECTAFALAVLVLNATPGVDLLLTLSRTLQGGSRAGVAAALGINVGCVVHALAAGLGLAAFLAVMPTAFRVLQWAGAAYLMWLGIGLLRQAVAVGAQPAEVAGEPMVRPWTADFRIGLLTNVLNPKVALFFLAFLPPFVPGDSPHPSTSFALLAGWFVVQSTVFLLGVVALAGHLARSGKPLAMVKAMKLAGGGLFIALALRLLRERPLTA